MPEVLTPPPAAAPAAAPATPPATPAAAPDPMLSPRPLSDAKPGSAKERMQKDLMAKANKGQEPAPEPAKTPEPAKPDLDAEPPPNTPEDKKAKPWRIVDQYKKRTAQLEKELADARSNALPEAEVKTLRERAESLQKKADQYEQEMRFIDYSKSEEFQSKYVAPYEAAFKRAVNELSEIQIDTGDGTKRNVGVQDILQLVNLPLGKARELADQLYGPFAQDAMAHRKELRSLFETQTAALEEARANGSKTLKERQEAFTKQATETAALVKKTWDEVNTTILGDEKYGHFFKPVEGDEDGNQRLAKGFELADRAFSENPNQPNLTPEQRKAIVKRHAALRNRAAAFGRLAFQNGQLQSKIAALEKELAQYAGSEPGNAQKPSNGAPVVSGKAIDRLRSGLAAIAH